MRYLDPLLDLMVEAVIEDLRAGQGGNSMGGGRHHGVESEVAPKEKHQHDDYAQRPAVTQET